jgi:inner membrane protein
VPTIMTHSFVGLAGATVVRAVAGVRLPARFWLLSVILPSLPDLDVLGHRHGVPHDILTGHRGASHSLLLAAAIGMLAGYAFFRRTSRWWWGYGLFFSLMTASHGLLDTITNGGGDVALLWPFSDRRFFAPWRPLAVSPIGVTRFLTSPRARGVLISEFVWVWVPAVGVMLLAPLWRQCRPRHVHGVAVEASGSRID